MFGKSFLTPLVGVNPPKSPLKSYPVYTSLEKSEIGLNPPKSPLKRGTSGSDLPLFKGAGGDLDLETKSSQLVYTP